MVIQHCIEAMNANRMFNINVKDQAKASEKLASGYRINRAADDAAGLAISEKMRRQIRGLTQASENAQDGISMVQTAEGALNEVHDMLQRINELCVKAANDTLQSVDREYIQYEIDEIQEEIDRTGATTTFNELKLLNGVPQEHVNARVPSLSYGGVRGSVTQATSSQNAYFQVPPLTSGTILTQGSGDQTVYYQIGGTYDEDTDGSRDHPWPMSKESVYRHVASRLSEANTTSDYSVTIKYSTSGSDEGKFIMEFHGPLKLDLLIGSESTDTLGVSIDAMNSSALGLWNVNVATHDNSGALQGIDAVKSAITINSQHRAYLGSIQNRLEHTIRNLDNVVENTTSSESVIRDTEMASTMVGYANRNILLQAGQTILSQANQSKQSVIRLLE
ncbi:MAG: flagellin [Butyrivibrio sp.]|nr:flagellin [Butyrivibrio sp.]